VVKKAERNAAMLAASDGGESARAIAARFGISTKRCYQILATQRYLRDWKARLLPT